MINFIKNIYSKSISFLIRSNIFWFFLFLAYVCIIIFTLFLKEPSVSRMCYEEKLKLLENTNYYQNKCLKDTIELTVEEFMMCKDLFDRRNAKLTFHPDECSKFSKKLVSAIKKVESNFNPRAISNKGAMGIMQIKFETAKSVGYKGTPEGLLDHEVNTRYSCKYLEKMYERFGRDIYTALDAYYRGPGNVVKSPWDKDWEEHPYVSKILIAKKK